MDKPQHPTIPLAFPSQEAMAEYHAVMNLIGEHIDPLQPPGGVILNVAMTLIANVLTHCENPVMPAAEVARRILCFGTDVMHHRAALQAAAEALNAAEVQGNG